VKRYRVLSFDFDSRAAMLAMEIGDDWDENVKDGHLQSKEAIRAGLVHEFGEFAAADKLKNFVELGPKPWSVIAFHNAFAHQARAAFVVGAYYPAVTAACALGERILNHLVLLLREDFRSTREYKLVYRKDSFDNWFLPIRTLEKWEVLLPDAAEAFRALAVLRNRVLHFDPATDHNDRELALDAIRLLDRVVDTQFGFFGTQPWFIPGIGGASYIRKAAEGQPFVSRIYLPNSHLVGPCHTIEFVDSRVLVHDLEEYPVREISDEEFKDLLPGGTRRTEALCNEV
jgi:hypothetical protein